MTLTRQLISAISAIFLAALLGVQAIHLRSAHKHLQDQLESLAQDTATSIGLSLGALMRDGDASLAETVINPVFDRGHYERIEFASTTGERLVSKTLKAHETGDYPRWFAELFPLAAPSAESLVSAGWRQIGKVMVKGHPRYAYEQLWATARDTALTLLAIYAAGLVALRLFLLGVLRPLVAVERAAQAISARNFITIELRPSTRELSRVVEAMNALSRRVREVISTETARADALQRAAYVDDVSGLLNRRGLSAHFENAYGEEREAFMGAFALIEIPELGPINRELGVRGCDELLHAVGSAVEEAAARAQGLAARWGGALFALLLPRIGPEAARAALAELQSRIGMIVAERGLHGRPAVWVGAAAAPGALADFEALANAAEEMLVRAREQGEGGLELHALSAEDGEGQGGDALGAVRDALAAQRVLLVGQAVLSLPGRTLLHTEIMARIRDASGATMPAADFIAIVSQHGLSRRLDEAVLECACQAAKGAAGMQTVAINLSARSLEHRDFIEWLTEALRAVQPLAARFVFEVSEHGVVHNEAAVTRLAAALKKCGAGFAIDHFGVHRNSLALVQHLKPAYLKLSHLHTQNLVRDAGTRFFVEAVARACRQLDIPVIAQNVEDESIVSVLEPLGVSGYQGYITGKPSPWPPAPVS